MIPFLIVIISSFAITLIYRFIRKRVSEKAKRILLVIYLICLLTIIIKLILPDGVYYRGYITDKIISFSFLASSILIWGVCKFEKRIPRIIFGFHYWFLLINLLGYFIPFLRYITIYFILFSWNQWEVDYDRIYYRDNDIRIEEKQTSPGFTRQTYFIILQKNILTEKIIKTIKPNYKDTHETWDYNEYVFLERKTDTLDILIKKDNDTIRKIVTMN